MGQSATMLRPTSKALFTIPHLVLVVPLVVGAGCGGEPPRPARTEWTEADRADQAKIDRCKAKIAGANRAFDMRRYDEARKLLKEATDLGVPSERFDIEQLTAKLDKQ